MKKLSSTSYYKVTRHNVRLETLISPHIYTGLKEAEFCPQRNGVGSLRYAYLVHVLNPIEPLKASVCFVFLLKILLDILI